MNDATLRPTGLIDSDHPAVRAFAARHGRGTDERERAVALYYAVRDGFRYDPYRIDLSPQGMKASTVLGNGHGWCVPKATLLAAACRAAGIPARVGFADVPPAFNIELCRRFDLLPLEFDGTADSLYHPFDRHGHRHMEYVNQRGGFDDVPLAEITADFARLYPRWLSGQGEMPAHDFLADAARETRR